MQFNARLKIGGGLAVFVHAHVARCHTFQAAVRVIQHFAGRKACVNLHAQSLRLFRQPFTQQTQTDDVIAFIVHIGNNGQPESLILRQKQQSVFGYAARYRRTALPPVGKQLRQSNGIHHRPRQNMRPHLAAFFQHAHADVPFRLRRKLFQPYRRRQPCRPRAHNQRVILHHIAHPFGLCLCLCHFHILEIAEAARVQAALCLFPYIAD